MSAQRICRVLSLGAGWQSTRLLLGSCRGELPKLDFAIFADTQYEPKKVYTHLKWLVGEARRAGIPVLVRSRGDLRKDAIEFRQLHRSNDGKRFASIPFFVKGKDGKEAMIRRQCTSEYKIEVVDKTIRREVLGLKPRARVPKGVTVEHWFGISADEPSRATFPGVFRRLAAHHYTDLLTGEKNTVYSRRWMPTRWEKHAYPLLNQLWLPNRTIIDFPFLKRPETREDVGAWLKTHFPARIVPRSACIGCPFHTNDEWKRMRDEEPEEFEDACRFDEESRVADADGQTRRGKLVELPFLHRQLVPLRQVDLNGYGSKKGGGCGTLLDGLDGYCDT